MDGNSFLETCKEKVKSGNDSYKLNVIDLDPYGSSIPFMENAIKSIENNGWNIFIL